jgi:sodium/potassium-transporting ATPase subunit alpha
MSSRRRRNSIDPATAFPITYRTVSYAIEETKEKERVEAVKAKKDAAAELGDLQWHTWSVNEVKTRLSTSLEQGLSKEQVERKQKEFGKNTPSKPPSDLFSRVMGYMFGGFGSVLLIGGVFGYDHLQTSRKSESSNRQLGTGHCSLCRFRYSSIIQCLARLVFF